MMWLAAVYQPVYGFQTEENQIVGKLIVASNTVAFWLHSFSLMILPNF